MYFKTNLLLPGSLLILCLISSTAFCQMPETLKKGTITTIDGQIIKFKNFKVEGDEISFFPTGSLVPFKIPVSNLAVIEGNDGSYAGVGLGVGAGLGLVVGILTAENIKKEEEGLSNIPGLTVEKTDTGPITFLLTGIGALGGFVTGSLIKKNEVIFTNPQTGKPTSYFNWSAGAVKGSPGMKFKFTF